MEELDKKFQIMEVDNSAGFTRLRIAGQVVDSEALAKEFVKTICKEYPDRRYCIIPVFN